MKREHGMAYVMLGRTEKLEDIFISGKIDFDGISCSKFALDECARLLKIFQEKQNDQMKEVSEYKTISYLNIRSLRNKIFEVTKTSTLMQSNILGLGETWLEPVETVQLDGYQSFFANYGRGKGVAVYSKENTVCEPQVIANDSLSMIIFTHHDIVAVFLYRSQNCDEYQLCLALENIIVENVPIVIMGDVNIDAQQESVLTTYLSGKGFAQQIQKPTCDTGSILDHVYVNKEMKVFPLKIKQRSVYYSDHDIISLHIKNNKS